MSGLAFIEHGVELVLDHVNKPVRIILVSGSGKLGYVLQVQAERHTLELRITPGGRINTMDMRDTKDCTYKEGR